MGLFSFLTQDIAVDLGTANTIIICNDKMVVNEPSIVAIDRKTEKVIAIGEKARQMQGKTHDNIKTIRPLRDGVIADFNAAEQMLRGMIKMASVNSKFFSPSLRIVVCIPSGSTEVEVRACLLYTSLLLFWNLITFVIQEPLIPVKSPCITIVMYNISILLLENSTTR